MSDPGRVDRRALRAALRSAYPWLEGTDWGPRAVEAGECPRCERAPRLVPTCGPVAWSALCRDCALDVGPAAWCEGHSADAAAVLDAIERLPPEWDTAVVLWWVATGEVRLGQIVLPPTAAGLPRRVHEALPGGSAGIGR